MSTLIPIDGAVLMTVEEMSFAPVGFDIATTDIARAPVGMEIVGTRENPARRGFDIGLPLQVKVPLGFDIGESIVDGVSLTNRIPLGFDINAERTVAAPNGFDVATTDVAGATAARTGFDIGVRDPVPVSVGFDIQGTQLTQILVGFDIKTQFVVPAGVGFDVANKNLTPVYSGFTIGGELRSRIPIGFDIRSSPDSFLILADIYPETAPASQAGVDGYYPTQFVRPSLTIGGVEIPIVEFDFQKPANKLGAVFNATIARFDTTGLTPDPALHVDFKYYIYDPVTQTETPIPRFTNGKLLGIEHVIAWANRGQNSGPADTISISVIDIVGDKFTLAPRRNVIMYDPNKTQPTDINESNQDALRDEESGFIIQPSLEEVVGLTSYDAMNRVYTGGNGKSFLRPVIVGSDGRYRRNPNYGRIDDAGVGLGFNRVITNLPDYPIPRADFSAMGTWHDGVLPIFAMYGPLFFDILNNLFILNTNWPLPYGFNARFLPASSYRQLTLITPVKDYTNAVVLTYKVGVEELAAQEGYYYLTRPITDDPEESGAPYGSPGYTRKTTTRQVRELRRSYYPEGSGTPVDQILDSIDLEIKTTTYTMFVAGDGGGGELMATHRETTTNTYAGDLKTNMHKTVEGVIHSGPDASLQLVTILQEDTQINWGASDDPDKAIQKGFVTRIEGMIITVQDTKSMIGRDGQMHEVRVKYPVLVAQASGILSDDIDTGFGPIREIRATLRGSKGQQQDMEIVDHDLLNGTFKFSHTQPTITSIRGAATSRYQAETRHMLIRDRQSELEIGARKPAGVNAGELPFELAHKLGKDVLAMLKSSRYEVRAELPGIDITLDRGSVITLAKRAGATGAVVVKGITEKGTPQGQRGFRIYTILDGDEL